MKIRVAIVDYGMGNVYSVDNAIKWLGYKSVVTNEASELNRADVLILPGVGAYGKAMESMRSRGLDKLLTHEVVRNGKPILGICLGMQMMASRSEEGGDFQGLDWIQGEVKKLVKTKDLYIPNVGWNETDFESGNALFSRLDKAPVFYYDHSYHFECEQKYVAATCNYGSPVVAAVQKDNIFGVQFHPEKSQKGGL